MSESIKIRLSVNGIIYERTIEPRIHLADFIRKELGLTGTHLGCEHGVCGACTLLVNGKSVRSCLMLAVQADACEVKTIEGVATNSDDLHPIQDALMKHHGLQCGFCTPGLVMTMLEMQKDYQGQILGDDEIRRALSGNLCRCTGYEGIVNAARQIFGTKSETTNI
jgi:aerobic-type carbon monoxide dehydrogenase small subunit (CoxS/CutS family)